MVSTYKRWSRCSNQGSAPVKIPASLANEEGEIAAMDVRKQKHVTSGSARQFKVHFELPIGEVVTFQLSRAALKNVKGLRHALLEGASSQAAALELPGLTVEQLKGMDMRYQDEEGDMVELTSKSNMAEVGRELQCLFVSKRSASARKIKDVRSKRARSLTAEKDEKERDSATATLLRPQSDMDV
eukprot:CAMPEP_0119299660 /NCGR_PEP_ID=MMETSP1333-20130426/1709_1 /TAXON_ID=418940 /ORGANISM="Scyphosphaera apsteinii, Strain RCC1455" /LENGTH=184 /DNA_ID=CAMNT_0007301159 /DNA_START=458 /DNA_END=1012 /DNA_ORIENTATION=-